MLAHHKPDGAGIALEQLLHADKILNLVPALGNFEEKIVFPFRRFRHAALIFGLCRRNFVETGLYSVFLFDIAGDFLLGKTEPVVQHTDSATTASVCAARSSAMRVSQPALCLSFSESSSS